jgi:uncharacterized protein YndB with AHSA1/START domain
MGQVEAFDPVIKRVRVDLPAPAAFQLFTEGMGQWWPLQTHSIAEDTYEGKVKAEDLVFEGRADGNIYEVMSDGTEASWGRVLVWEPPVRVVFSWKPNLEEEPHTEVEVRFREQAGGTEVELEHRGWERLGERGSMQRSGYDAGWPGVLELFSSAAVRS